MARIYLIIFLFLFFTLLSFAQKDNLCFDNLTTEDGLSHNYVTSIIQDSQGFMWFGTIEGLNRWDGKKFKLFSNVLFDSTSLSLDYTSNLFLDSKGVLWVSTFYGLNRYENETESFKRFFFPDSLLGHLGINTLWCLIEDKNGILWIGSEVGLIKFNPATKEYSRYLPDPDRINTTLINANRVRKICLVDDRKLYLGTMTGLFIFDLIDLSFEEIVFQAKHTKNLQIVGSKIIRAIHRDGDNLWIGTAMMGLFEYNIKKKQLYNYRLKYYQSKQKHPQIENILEDKSKKLLLSIKYGNGLFLFDKVTKEFMPYQSYEKNENNISKNIRTVYRDNQRNIWIGTEDKGISKIARWQKPFTNVEHTPKVSKKLSSAGIWSICEDDRGNLWIASFGYGITRYNLTSKQYFYYPYHTSSPRSTLDNRISTVYKDRSGAIWLGTNGLERYNPETDSFTHFIHNPSDSTSISNSYIFSIFEDNSGYLWLGMYGAGLDRFDRQKNTFLHYRYSKADTNSLCSTIVNCLLQDKYGKLWIGTEDGLCKLVDANQKNGKFIRYVEDQNKKGSLSYNKVLCLFEDKTGRLWIGTYYGLNLYDRKTNTFTIFTKKDGLPSNSIAGILEDTHGNLWLRTSRGLTKFNPEKRTFQNYSENDGFKYSRGDVLNSRAFYKDKKGEIYYGGMNGFTVFHPDSLINNPEQPRIIITDFLIRNKSVEIGSTFPLKKSITLTNEIELNHEQNMISFEFAALDYTSPEKNLYAYKMEGVDPDWVYTDASRRFATYTQLDPGEYIFRVKGSNNDGIWNEEGTSVKVIILPPWWRTNFAYAFYIIFIGLIVWLTWHFQTNRLKMSHELAMEHLHAEKLEEVDRLKSHFFANISHEFRTPLTLILGPVKQMFSGEFKGNFKEQYKIIIRNGERLLNLINQLLDLSKLESGKLELQAQATDIVSLTNGLVQAFESLAVRKEITLKFKTEIESQEVYIDKDKFEKIINNLLSNAFKFTPEGGVVEVAVGSDSSSNQLPSASATATDFVEITVTNTGPGIPADRIEKIFDRFYQVNDSYKKDEEGTGIGLALTKELVELHHGEIYVESIVASDKGTGLQPPESPFNKGDLSRTTFTVLLPIGKEHLKENEIIDIPEKSIKSPLSKGVGGMLEPLDEATKVEGKEQKSKSQSPVSGLLSPIILIVEDNADLRKYIRSSMQNEYQILEAENGEEGFAKATEEIPDLIISDVMMPEMDGFELCNKLKTDQRTSHIPVILLTARAAKEDKIQGLETGADDFIAKPFDSDELKIRIKNLINQRKQLREKFSKEFLNPAQDIILTSADEKFLQKALKIINGNLSNLDFTVEDFSKEIAFSRFQLHRKIKALTDQSISEFIRSIRLKHGAQLLAAKSGNITEIAYECGFNNLSYFSRCFKEMYGTSPAEYIANVGKR